MTLFEFAIARVAAGLMRDAGKRELTDDEWRLLHNLSPALRRIEAKEAGAAESPACPPAKGGRSTANIPGGIG